MNIPFGNARLLRAALIAGASVCALQRHHARGEIARPAHTGRNHADGFTRVSGLRGGSASAKHRAHQRSHTHARIHVLLVVGRAILLRGKVQQRRRARSRVAGVDRVIMRRQANHLCLRHICLE